MLQNAARATAGGGRCDPQVIDRAGGKIDQAHTLGANSLQDHHDRAWWAREARQEGTDWNGTVPLWWLDFIECPHCGLAPCDDPLPEPKPKPQRPRPIPTPQATIEAVMHSVREGGIVALKSTANVRRLSLCDAAAKAEINRRIARFTS